MPENYAKVEWHRLPAKNRFIILNGVFCNLHGNHRNNTYRRETKETERSQIMSPHKNTNETQKERGTNELMQGRKQENDNSLSIIALDIDRLNSNHNT